MPSAFPATEPSWALRAYLVLIGCAFRSETITYGQLAMAIKRGGPKSFGGISRLSRSVVHTQWPTANCIDSGGASDRDAGSRFCRHCSRCDYVRT